MSNTPPFDLFTQNGDECWWLLQRFAQGDHNLIDEFGSFCFRGSDRVRGGI